MPNETITKTQSLSVFHAITLSIVLACLSACSSPPKGPFQYSINAEGDQVLNRDVNGQSLSVVIRLYQLRDANEFSKLTFDTLIIGHPETELLGPSLISKTDLVLVPGGTYAAPVKLLDETRYLGIVGLFRKPDPHLWRQLVDTLDAKGNRIAGVSFRAKDCYIEITGEGQLLLPGQPSQPKGECGPGNDTSINPPQTTRRDNLLNEAKKLLSEPSLVKHYQSPTGETAQGRYTRQAIPLLQKSLP